MLATKKWNRKERVDEEIERSKGDFAIMVNKKKIKKTNKNKKQTKKKKKWREKMKDDEEMKK